MSIQFKYIWITELTEYTFLNTISFVSKLQLVGVNIDANRISLTKKGTDDAEHIVSYSFDFNK